MAESLQIIYLFLNKSFDQLRIGDCISRLGQLRGAVMKKAMFALLAVGFLMGLTSCEDDRKCNDPGKCNRGYNRYEKSSEDDRGW